MTGDSFMLNTQPAGGWIDRKNQQRNNNNNNNINLAVSENY
jgi:hypothetical protein